MPEVCQLISEVRIQIFMINIKNLDCWNHPNMFSLKNRRGGDTKILVQKKTNFSTLFSFLSLQIKIIDLKNDKNIF